MGDFGIKYLPLTGEELGTRKFSEIRLHPDRLEIPLRWRKPRRIFVCSMGDPFHEGVPTDFQELVFRTMISASQHAFQVLTKRAFAMQAAIPVIMHRICGPHWAMPTNIWLGVTAENQAAWNERVPLLQQTPAAIRFVSCEPLLGPIYSRDLRTQSVDWVICGGESGPNARPMHPDWARSLRDQCVAARVPFHFKQWGEWAPVPNGEESATPHNGYVRPYPEAKYDYDNGYCKSARTLEAEGFANMQCIGKHAAGRLIDGREWLEFPKEIPA
jgi:protein gp37